jgi:hypothetical protein
MPEARLVGKVTSTSSPGDVTSQAAAKTQRDCIGG